MSRFWNIVLLVYSSLMWWYKFLGFIVFMESKWTLFDSPLLFSSLGSEEGGVPPRAVRPLQPDGPLPGTTEGLWMRGPRRRQRAAAPGLQPYLCPGGRHGPLQEDAGTHVSPAGRCREPPEEGKTPRRREEEGFYWCMLLWFVNEKPIHTLILIFKLTFVE